MPLAERYERTYTVEAVAELLHCSPAGVRAMIRRGELRALKISRLYLIPESAIDNLGFGELKLFADIEDASAYVKELRQTAERKPDGSEKTDEEFLAEVKAAE